MKANTKFWQLLALAGSFVIAVLLAGCGHLERGSDARQEKDLDEVVEALQYAIETAAASNVWKATEQEGKHWTEACTDAKAKAANACFAMFTKAIPLCQQVCVGSNCSPTGQRQCEQLIKGESVDQLCAGTIRAAQSDWCTAARGCNSANKVAAPMCENAASIVMPELVKADVALSVERKRDISGSVNLMVVTFGGARSEVATNELAMTLKPRVRDTAYGSTAITAMPGVKAPSERAKSLAADLAKVITDAVAASVKEYEPGTPAVAKRGPVLVSDLEVTFSLTVDSDGKLGIKKAWETPAGIELGVGRSIKRVNSMTVTYARPK
jgi:hypothetical protein